MELVEELGRRVSEVVEAEAEAEQEGEEEEAGAAGRAWVEGGRWREEDAGKEGGGQASSAFTSGEVAAAAARVVGGGFGHAPHTIQGDASMVKWCDLKSPDRAVEKAVRAYKGDVSQLVDLNRQCIIFENVADLLACLETIERDADVHVERIKNRLSPDYNPKLSSGYRDVALNLRIVNPETLGMGIETHISEVQLILLPFYELKTNEGHKRYVAFRNLRAE